MRALEAQLANAQASSRELDEQVGGDAARGGVKQADARIRELQMRLDLARRRVPDLTEQVKTDAEEE